MMVFRNYLQYGYLPVITDSEPDEIPIRLDKIMNLIIETDLSFIEGYSFQTAIKVKKLLGVLAESVPFKPNI